MSQVVFSQSNIGPGQTSAAFTAPTANADGTGSRLFVLYISRDPGAINSVTGDNDINQPAVVEVHQNGVILNTTAGGIASALMFEPVPGGGACTIVNNGPGSVTNVSVEDNLRR